MKFAFTFILLVACAHAIPITRDAPKEIQSAAIDTPTLLVGSSQVDSKTDGKITLHLDQRSQIPQDIQPFVEKIKVEPQPEVAPIVVSLPVPVEEVKQPVPVAVPVVVLPEEPKPVLTGRSQPAEQEAPVSGQVTEPQVIQNPVSVPAAEKPVLVIEEVPIPAVVPAEPAIVVAFPQAPVASEIPVPAMPQAAVPEVVVPEQVPQTFIQPVAVPEIPAVVVPVPQEPVPVVVPVGQLTLEERSSVPQIPIAAGVEAPAAVIPEGSIVKVVEPAQEQAQVVLPTEVKEVPSARNFKVDQTSVKAPVVISTVQKQEAAVEIKSEIKDFKLEAKHAVVPEQKPQPAQVQVQQIEIAQPVQAVPSVPAKPIAQVEAQETKVVLEERRSEPVQPVEIAKPVEVKQLAGPAIPKEQQTEVVVNKVQAVPVAAVPVEQAPVVESTHQKKPFVVQVAQPEQVHSVVSEPAKVQPVATEEKSL